MPGQCGAASCSGQACRLALGLRPKHFLKAWAKCESELKPEAVAISRTPKSVEMSSTRACCNRSNNPNCTMLQPTDLLNCRSNCRCESPTCLAISGTLSGSEIFASIISVVGIGIVAIIAYLATLKLGGINQFLPVLGAFVLGAQKLLPAIQKAYASYSRIKGSAYSLDDVLELLDQPIPDHANVSSSSPIAFMNSIELKNLSFRYSDESPWVLKDLNLIIPKGSVIGVIGSTGCGKSTLLDIIMSLLSSTSGELLIDNMVINNTNKKSWQTHISSVPQDIYLSDGTIEENIAFGLPREEINQSRVKIAAQQAQISDLVDSWDDGYQTIVGERGTRLSGGQRQRIGLARAFYRQSDVLILDEATSALDNDTESAVMDAINNFDHNITVIIIAHRLTTLKNCDMILSLGSNHQTEIMKYDEIMNLKENRGDQYVE